MYSVSMCGVCAGGRAPAYARICACARIRVNAGACMCAYYGMHDGCVCACVCVCARDVNDELRMYSVSMCVCAGVCACIFVHVRAYV